MEAELLVLCPSAISRGVHTRTRSMLWAAGG